MHFFISDMSELATMRNAERSCGAKMARLGKALGAGFSVPRGFVLDVSACREALEDPAVSDAITAAMEGIDERSTPEALAHVRPRVQSALEEFALQDDLLESLREACEALGEGARLAVRSSAPGEDAHDASFAGQFETTLGVVGFDAVMSAMRRCWSSPFSAPALAYRASRGVLENAMPMAVGVLELVDATVAGVAFSVHPVTRRRNRVVIEANWGLGETVVSGTVSPDHIEIGKTDLRILDYAIGAKQHVAAFSASEGRVVDRVASPDEASVRCLSDDEAMLVAATTVELEDVFGHAVDVEWAIAPGLDGAPSRLVVLQVRPVTIREEPMVVRSGYDPIGMILERTARKVPTGG